MEIECRNNIKELHVFIESWLKGSVKKYRQEFQYFEDLKMNSMMILSLYIQVGNSKLSQISSVISGIHMAYSPIIL